MVHISAASAAVAGGRPASCGPKHCRTLDNTHSSKWCGFLSCNARRESPTEPSAHVVSCQRVTSGERAPPTRDHHRHQRATDVITPRRPRHAPTRAARRPRAPAIRPTPGGDRVPRRRVAHGRAPLDAGVPRAAGRAAACRLRASTRWTRRRRGGRRQQSPRGSGGRRGGVRGGRACWSRAGRRQCTSTTDPGRGAATATRWQGNRTRVPPQPPTPGHPPRRPSHPPFGWAGCGRRTGVRPPGTRPPRVEG